MQPETIILLKTVLSVFCVGSLFVLFFLALLIIPHPRERGQIPNTGKGKGEE